MIANTLSADRRPRRGPITIVPATATHTASEADFVEAVLSSGAELAAFGPRTRGLIWLSYGGADALAATLESHPSIDWVQLPYAGVDAFAGLLASYADRPLPLWTSAKGAYSQPVAEHALTLTLALLRVIPERARATSWPMGPKTGSSLFGVSIVIVGAGGIAVELIRLLEPFGAHVTIVRRSASEVAGAERTVTSDRLREVLPDADVVVIAAASTAGTRRMFSSTEFAVMKRSSVLVNIARGDLVDSDALVAALATGEIAGAGLDVTDPEPLPDGHPLWTAPNILITPHSADTPAMTAPLLADRIRDNVAAFVGDGRFIGVVDPRAGY
ncbi:NAD(P)-dependent oxidoreductase [Glaciihabitans sp. GrIS 2.15]|uniref:NAD(P)-dependent oxidoreductase n=1 Tax=Glaciihabitans sp. GrIS 2.15 TaxID=3071710 RepID=UPI002DFA1E21|nr:phosphoglycerate dehydrogenase-like enzyme [Glaciihabitans sp. GrIS 2.15]